MRKLFFNNRSGITLVALVVTIIVLLILAGISLNLIAGSNGIMERATKAADMYDDTQLKESLELSNAEMLLDCLGGGDLQTDLYDYIVKRCEKNIDKIVQTSNGKYWIDTDGRLCYTDSDTNGTVKLRKDSNGNPKIIDPNTPITTYRVQYDANGGTGVPTDTREYEEGETVNVNFGTTPTREKYVFLGWSKNANATTPEYTSAGNFTMGTQNVTLYAVWTGVSGTGTSIIKSAWYGNTVNYSANGVEDWKVFLNDGTNVYLIASDYVERSKITLNDDVEAGDGDYSVKGKSRDGLVNWLQTANNWINFKGTYVDSVTGGPTLAQFWASYNAKYGTNYSAERQIIGQAIDGLYFLHENEWNSTGGYWLTNATSWDSTLVEGVRYNSSIGGYINDNYYYERSCNSSFSLCII